MAAGADYFPSPRGSCGRPAINRFAALMDDGCPMTFPFSYKVISSVLVKVRCFQ